MRRIADLLLLSGSLLVALGALSACAETSLPEPERPEIPSRAEVFESERLHRPASAAAVEALRAYEAKVCVPAAGPRFTDEAPRRRGCFGPGPVEEIRLLEELRRSDPHSADQPKIIERMIADWQDVQDRAASQCVPLQLGPTPTVQKVEEGLRAVYALERVIDRSRTEPAKLCAELRDSYPNHVRRVHCPGDPPSSASPPASDSPEPAEADWPVPPSSPPARDPSSEEL